MNELYLHELFGVIQCLLDRLEKDGIPEERYGEVLVRFNKRFPDGTLNFEAILENFSKQ